MQFKQFSEMSATVVAVKTLKLEVEKVRSNSNLSNGQIISQKLRLIINSVQMFEPYTKQDNNRVSNPAAGIDTVIQSI